MGAIIESTERKIPYKDTSSIYYHNLQSASPGLQRLSSIISKERGVLLEYAAKASANPKYVALRDDFLQKLSDSYNLLHSELAPVKELYFVDTWMIADKQVRLLMQDTSIDGVHIRFKIGSGNNYGHISL